MSGCSPSFLWNLFDQEPEEPKCCVCRIDKAKTNYVFTEYGDYLRGEIFIHPDCLNKFFTNMHVIPDRNHNHNIYQPMPPIPKPESTNTVEEKIDKLQTDTDTDTDWKIDIPIEITDDEIYSKAYIEQLIQDLTTLSQEIQEEQKKEPEETVPPSPEIFHEAPDDHWDIID
jgi:hypothetical protein